MGHDRTDDRRADAANDPTAPEGFEALDLCHRHTMYALGKLAALLSRLGTFGADDAARALAREVLAHFSTTLPRHHADEEREVFPLLLAGGDAQTLEMVRRLQQDHAWLDEDWLALSPHLDAIANGQSWYDLDVLREGASIFSALARDHVALEESVLYPRARDALRRPGACGSDTPAPA